MIEIQLYLEELRTRERIEQRVDECLGGATHPDQPSHDPWLASLESLRKMAVHFDLGPDEPKAH